MPAPLIPPDAGTPPFRILGPLKAPATGRLEPLQRRLLAVLLLQPGTYWPRADLARALWGDRWPPAAGEAIRATMYRLRRALADDRTRLTHTSGGYQFAVLPAETDAGQLASLAAQGRTAWYSGDLAAAAALLGQATRLWREPALADVPSTPALTQARARLRAEYHDAVSLLIDTRLRMGQAAEIIAVLRPLIAAEPLNEHAWVQLITALAQAGDLPAAAAASRAARTAVGRTRRRPPGPELARLATAITGR